jgi:hypothetical protein
MELASGEQEVGDDLPMDVADHRLIVLGDEQQGVILNDQRTQALAQGAAVGLEGRVPAQLPVQVHNPWEVRALQGTNRNRQGFPAAHAITP